MSRSPHGFTSPTKPPPASAGRGFRFLRVGELIRRGDQFWTHGAAKWLPAANTFHAVAAELRNRYRRRVR